MEQPAGSPDGNPLKHNWNELGRAVSNMDNPPQNLVELRLAILDKGAEILIECLQGLVASMTQRIVAIIAARGGNARYWPAYTKPHYWAASYKKSNLFDQIYHNYYPVTLRYARAVNFSNINKCHHKFTKIHIKQNNAYNT